jgi:hypothetical protein
MIGLDFVVIPAEAYGTPCWCDSIHYVDRSSLHVDESNGDAQVRLNCPNEHYGRDYYWTVSRNELRALQGLPNFKPRFSPELLALVPDWPDLLDGDPGDEPIDTFFEMGYCHALALALNEATGWPIVGVWSQGDCTHFVVQRPDCMLVDVRGVRSEEEVLESWGAHALDDGWDPKDLWHMRDMENPEDVWELAKVVAEALLDDM